MNLFKKDFQNPPKQYSPAPLWFLYGKLEARELNRQVDAMVAKGVYNAFMHPRAYLLTPYLEEEWWEVIGKIVAHAKEVGFHPWIYDEYAWPSGTAGSVFKYSKQKPSRVLAEGNQNIAMGLRYQYHDCRTAEVTRVKARLETEQSLITLAVKLDEQGKLDERNIWELTDRTFEKKSGPEDGRYRVVAFFKYLIPGSVNYLNKKAIESFIRYTHEEYKKRYGAEFGGVIPGVFFDEIFNVGTPLVWSDDFAAEFQKRKGYDLLKMLPLLIWDGGFQTAQVRNDYYSVLTDLYEETFFAPLSRWCEANHLRLTGHTEEYLEAHPLRQGDYFRTMRHLHIPGGDCHDYRYKHPRQITPVDPKGAVSVARLNRRERCMSEAMGGAGWATSLQEFKRGINVLAALGINFFVLHGFYSEINHQGSQGDWPGSFFWQNPYWKYFNLFAEYIGRLSYLGTQGKPVCQVGLFYPIHSLYERFADGAPTGAGKIICDQYQAALDQLLAHQIDTDLIDETALQAASWRQGRLQAGDEAFQALVFPDVSGISEATAVILQAFMAKGGQVVFYRCGPREGLHRDFPQTPLVSVEDGELIPAIRQLIAVDLQIVSKDAPGIYYYHRRRDAYDYYLVVNSTAQTQKITVRFHSAGYPCRGDLETGRWENIDSFTTVDEGYCELDLGLEADEACAVLFEPERTVNQAGRRAGSPYAALALAQQWSMLPAGPDLDQSWQIPDGPTGLSLEFAEFTSSLQHDRQTIKICNRPDEPGSCARYLSQWEAAWITRRPSWYDDSGAKQLFFRKIFQVDAPVVAAVICVAAVNRFVVYVNGDQVAAGSGWQAPTSIVITDYLKKGLNLIAVQVANDTPLQEKYMLEAEEFQPDTLTSLLLQGKIRTTAGEFSLKTDQSWITASAQLDNWEKPDLKAEATAIALDVTTIAYPWNRENPTQWLYAWQRGLPPLKPWGNLDLYGAQLTFPVTLEYRIDLPLGSVRLKRPILNGEWVCDIDGRRLSPAQFQNDWVGLPQPEQIQKLRLKVTVTDYTGGLRQPLTVKIARRQCRLDDWCKAGFSRYSGRMIYQTEFKITTVADNLRYELDLGTVNFNAEIWINGALAGVRLWAPYRMDITDLIKPGCNCLQVAVTNLLANQMWQSVLDEGKALGWNRYWYEENIDRDAQNLVSGLLGPVQIKLYQNNEISESKFAFQKPETK
jgi:hypothetical protein